MLGKPHQIIAGNAKENLAESNSKFDFSLGADPETQGALRLMLTPIIVHLVFT
jgi:hypothetical protein